MPTPEPLKPSARLLCKLGSIVVHADEFLSADGHDFDRQELLVRIKDPEVEAWIAAMDKLTMVPKKRKDR